MVGDSSSHFPHYNNGYYDTHFSNLVLHWLTDQEKDVFFRTALNCLKPGGTIATLTAACVPEVMSKGPKTPVRWTHWKKQTTCALRWKLRRNFHVGKGWVCHSFGWIHWSWVYLPKSGELSNVVLCFWLCWREGYIALQEEIVCQEVCQRRRNGLCKVADLSNHCKEVIEHARNEPFLEPCKRVLWNLDICWWILIHNKPFLVRLSMLTHFRFFKNKIICQQLMSCNKFNLY